jgi:hypothetical protein
VPRPQGAPPSEHRVEAATRTLAAGDGGGAARAAGTICGGLPLSCLRWRRCRACGGVARAARHSVKQIRREVRVKKEESFTCTPLKKLLVTCVPLKVEFAPTCH